MNKPTNRISNVTETSFVLHFSLNDTLKYCKFTKDIEERISQCVKSLVGPCVDQNYYISEIDTHRLDWIKESPAPSLSTAPFVLNSAHIRDDASGNIFSVKIQMDSTQFNYNKGIIDGVRAGEYFLIPRAVIVYGDQGYFYYLKPFQEPGLELEYPVGGVKLIGFDFFFLPKTLTASVGFEKEAQKVVDGWKEQAKPEPKEDLIPGGWGTNKTPDIRYPEHQPTYNGVRLSVNENKNQGTKVTANEFRVEGSLTLEGPGSIKNSHE